MEFQQYDELHEQATALIAQAEALVTKDGAGAEDFANAKQMLVDAQGFKKQCATLRELEELKSDVALQDAAPHRRRKEIEKKLDTFGKFLVAVYKQTHQRIPQPALKHVTFEGEPGAFSDRSVRGWVETKDLTEGIGADGGFLMFPEFRNKLLMVEDLPRVVRERATIIPMRARQVFIPSLDQTGTTAGTSNFYGGILPMWTEEAEEKHEEQPEFRQVGLTAHKLVVYTEASDELLADSAIGLEALLVQLFGSSILNEEEWAFNNGTGTGQPLGVVHVGAQGTIRVPRQAANQIQILDLFNMLSQFMGHSPVWLAHQSTMPQILQLNGPAGNPSYVWIGNGRDAMPTTLMGYPIIFIENCPPLGSAGDIILGDWSKYLIGDRQSVTIDSSKHFRFQHDLTAWRAVHRVDGRPWLSQPITYRDGATQVSPFVILDAAVAT